MEHSQNIQLMELMKLRDKLKKKKKRERERAKSKKTMWSCFGSVVSIVFMWLVEEFLFGGHKEYPTFRKWVLGTLIAIGVLALLAGILYWLHVLPKDDKEIAELKQEIKNLESSIR